MQFESPSSPSRHVHDVETDSAYALLRRWLILCCPLERAVRLILDLKKMLRILRSASLHDNFHAVAWKNLRCRFVVLVLELTFLFLDILRDRLALAPISFEVGLTVSFNCPIGHCRFSRRHGGARRVHSLRYHVRR